MSRSYVYSQSFIGNNRVCENTKPKLVVVPSNGIFYNGMSSSYTTSYINDLDGIVSEEEFIGIIGTLNETIQNYWPCLPCVTFGYICYPMSFLSCFPTAICIRNAETYATDFLDNLNSRPKYADRLVLFDIDHKVYLRVCAVASI